MKNPKFRLKEALKKTLEFMLSVDAESSSRIPEWYDQFSNELSFPNQDGDAYLKIISRLKVALKKEYGSSAAKHLLA